MFRHATVSKTELLIHFVAWTLAKYPDSNYIYVSYSHSLAKKQTQTIRNILNISHYKKIFGINLKDDTQAKDNFETVQGGSIYAVGSGGTITGRGAGIHGENRFGGAIILDDLLKPSEATSDTVRESVNEWYYNTLQSRLNNPNTPIIFIGQRLHENDIAARLIKSEEYSTLIIPAIDEAGNALHPGLHKKEVLLKMKENSPYEFSAQYQQDPQPAGGGIFKEDWFVILYDEPKIISTFITADTAETDKDYNDATVFSFWGMYKISHDDIETGIYGLHWLNCVEIRIEPKDLQNEFINFYRSCMQHKIKPRMAAIEKKSTGVTLLSTLKGMQGLQIIDIVRTKASGSKTARYLEAQPIVSSRRISLPSDGTHTKMCIDHCKKITANSSHRWDDVCFIKGTIIATLFGNKNIEDIKVNDLILTPFGFGKVVGCGMTKICTVVENIGLIGTNNHPIFYGNEFKALDTLNDDVKISYLSLLELIKWKYLKLSYSMTSNIELQGREGIILASKKIVRKGRVLKDFMWQFMNFIAEKKYGKATLFITRMAIVIITTSTIWSVFQGNNILNYILKKGKKGIQLIKNYSIWKILEKKHLNGIEVKKEENGIVKMLKIVTVKYFMIEIAYVLFVVKSLFLRKMQNHVVEFATQKNIECVSEILQENVLYAKKNLLQERITHKAEIGKHVHHYAKLEQEVYNLNVEKDHVYYANNILVSNCDTMYDAIKLALIDEVIIKKIASAPDNVMARNVMSTFNKIDRLKKSAYEN